MHLKEPWQQPLIERYPARGQVGIHEMRAALPWEIWPLFCCPTDIRLLVLSENIMHVTSISYSLLKPRSLQVVLEFATHFLTNLRGFPLKGSWLIRDHWWTWTGGCVCVHLELFFFPSWLALAVKAAVLVISWLALQGKKILIFAACGREDVIMLLSHLTDRHLCWTHSTFHLRALNEYPSSPLPRPAHLYLQCSLLFLPGLQSLPFVPPSWQLMPPHLTSHWWILSVKKPK